jgi:FkbM family methyltransferase
MTEVNYYAIEEYPRVYSYLKINKQQNNLNNLHLFNLAIHEKGNIEIPFFSPLVLNGKGSFSPVFTDQAEMVKTIRLDDFLISHKLIPDFIKVDVEGYELSVFKSLSKVKLKNCIILFEFVDWAEEAANYKIGEAQRYLLDLEYNLFRFSKNDKLTKEITSGSEMIISTQKLSVTDC